jgi:ribosomal protein L11 methyltransferase
MPLQKTLWLLNIALPSHAAEFFADALGNEALAVTTITPPRHKIAQVQAIYNYEPDAKQIGSKLTILSAALSIPVPKHTVHVAPPLDWLKKVATDFPPLRIARWTVHGAMHRHKLPHRLYALQIDATNAFGTGEHPTTRGCLLLLDKILKSGKKPKRIVDIGCGSGILAMGAIQSTRGLAVAVDLDPDSVQIALSNVRKNGLGRHIMVGLSRGYGASLVRRHAPYDLIMANIFAKPLSQIAKDLKQNLRSGGIAILSGLLTSQANMVIAAHKMQGLALLEHMKIGEWSVLALERLNRAR